MDFKTKEKNRALEKTTRFLNALDFLRFIGE